MAAIGATFLLVACGATDTTSLDHEDDGVGGETGAVSEDEQDADGTATEADVVSNKSKPPVVLPYESFFMIKHDQDSRRFVVSKRVSVTVTSKAEWSNPGACRGTSTYTITMLSDAGDYDGGGKRFPINDREQGASWQDLKAGKYYVLVSVQNPNLQRCELHGKLRISIT